MLVVDDDDDYYYDDDVPDDWDICQIIVVWLDLNEHW